MSAAKKETIHALDLSTLNNPSHYMPKIVWENLTPSDTTLYSYIIKNALVSYAGPAETHFVRVVEYYEKLEQLLIYIENKIYTSEMYKRHFKHSLAQELRLFQLKPIKERIKELEGVVHRNIELLVENAMLQLQLSLIERKLKKAKQKYFFRITTLHRSISIRENIDLLKEEADSIRNHLLYQEKMMQQNAYLVFDVTSRVTALLQTMSIMAEEKKKLVDHFVKSEKEVFELKRRARETTSFNATHKDLYYLSQQLKTKEQEASIFAKEISMMTLTPEEIVTTLQKQNDVIEFQIKKVHSLRTKLQKKKIEFIVSTLNLDKLNHKIDLIQEKIKSITNELNTHDNEGNTYKKKKLLNKINLVAKQCLFTFLKNLEVLKNNELNVKTMDLEEKLNTLEHSIYKTGDGVQAKHQHWVAEKIHAQCEVYFKMLMDSPSTLKTFTMDIDIDLPPALLQEIKKDNSSLKKEVEEFKLNFEKMLNVDISENQPVRNNPTSSLKELNNIYKKNLKAIMNLIMVNELTTANNAMEAVISSFEVLQKSFELNHPPLNSMIHSLKFGIQNIEQEAWK